MKLDFIIICSILVITCFLPFILFPYIGRKEEKKLKTKFKEEASRLGLNISYELYWNTNRAGIDILKRQFLLIQNPDTDFEIKHVDLNKVSQIRLISKNLTVKQQGIPV